jgi:predicted DNA-binding transcriptional regulator YafY
MQYIDRELRNNCYPNCNRVACHFEVSSKSIQRDIEYMRDMLQAPIDYDKKKKGYFYKQHWAFLTSAFLDQHEVEALKATKKVLSQYQGTPYFEEISSALDKVLQYLPASHSEHGILDIYSFEQPSSAEIDTNRFALIEDAIRNSRKIAITYHASSKQAQTERTVHPYRLHYDQSKSTWYLIAYCELRQATRTFAINRIRSITPCATGFTIPESFSIENYLEQTFDQCAGSEEHAIAIRFTPYQSQWIKEHRWHPTQQIEEHEDGSITLHMKVSALDAVKRWVMRYGKEAEALEPEELRDMVREEVARMGEMYLEKKEHAG